MRLRRLFTILATVGALVFAQAMVASRAYADTTDLACNYDYISFNACLHFESGSGLDLLTARAGLDSFMPERAAQEIIDYGADVRASLWADDGANDHYLADLALMPRWPAAWSGGLGVDTFATDLQRSLLNEDADGDDELYARISYYNVHTHTRMTFDTGVVHGDFRPMTGGGWQCLLLC
jgi:hypothetical protein